MKFGEWQFYKFDEQCSPLALHRRRASVSFQSRAWPSGHCVGTAKASAWLLCASWSRYKPATIAVLRFLFSSVFQSPPPLLRRALAVDLAPLPSRQSPSQASPIPCAPSQPTLVACIHRELVVRALLPRGRQHLRRGCSVVASTLR